MIVLGVSVAMGLIGCDGFGGPAMKSRGVFLAIGICHDFCYRKEGM